jgi:hypothetical protein
MKNDKLAVNGDLSGAALLAQIPLVGDNKYKMERITHQYLI